MKKKVFIIIGAAVTTVVMGIGIYHSDASQNDQILSKEEITSLISSQYPGEVQEIEIDDDFKQPVYEVEIKNDGVEYELKVDAKSGEIKQLKERHTLTVKEGTDKQTGDVKKEETKKEVKKEKASNDDNKEAKPKTSVEKKASSKDKKQESTSKEEKTKKGNSNKNAVISRDEAIKIALNEFSGKVSDVELDDDDGRLIYEIEIERGELEADIEIDAYTGKIIVMEVDD